MNNVIYVEFPKQSKRKLPRKRVFYLGQYYAGPPLCQSLEHLWLKRKPDNRWVFQQKIYGIVFEYEEYDGDDLLAALDNIPLVDEVTMDDLLEMGWRHQGEVIQYA
jgi:hypothetical protein|tara:strand:- start:346 stop:663 length:318 start_codon:yes stop_codon:yes gene_type:complete